MYPLSTTLKCPACHLSYALYSSWTRHLSVSHPSSEIHVIFVCADCSREFPTRRAVATHYRSHNTPRQPLPLTQTVTTVNTVGGHGHPPGALANTSATNTQRRPVKTVQRLQVRNLEGSGHRRRTASSLTPYRDWALPPTSH